MTLNRPVTPATVFHSGTELVHGELDSGRHMRNFPAKQYGTDIKTTAPHQFLYENR